MRREKSREVKGLSAGLAPRPDGSSDSAYYGVDILAAARRAGARFSITARMTATVKKAIADIPDDGWTAIHYPNRYP